MKFRVGIGYDVHALRSNREFWLGGVKIEHEMGLYGHSDADVLIHAVCDSILGAAGLGDIGTHFPDNDAQFKNIDSKLLLKRTVGIVRERGWDVNNVDVTVCLQRPKIASYIPLMRSVLSEIIAPGSDVVSIKATTTEKLGFEGREEGVSAMAVTLLVSD